MVPGVLCVLCVSLGGIAAGCGQDAGAIIYTLGMYPTQVIPAEYKIPPGNVLVLVDDYRDLIQPTTARDALVDEMAKRLKEQQIAERVTTNEELAELRRREPRFDERGAREIGEMANADTVVWLNTVDFAINNDLEMVVTPARFSVTVRVLNAKAETAEEVRMWPEAERDGRLVSSQVSPHDIRACKNLKQAHALMATTLAEEVMKLFYDQKIR